MPGKKANVEAFASRWANKGNEKLEKAIESAYGIDFNGDENKIVSHLFNLYADKVGE